MRRDFNSLTELFEKIPNERIATEYFTSIRWKHGEYCPHCGSTTIYHFSPKEGVTYPVYKCGGCRCRFSIKVGTVMENTKLPILKWLAAMWIITSHKKGISSVQLGKDLGIHQGSAWFMLHRLRHAARTRSFNRPLSGEVEVDEAFMGGKEANKHRAKRGLQSKAIVFGALEPIQEVIESCESVVIRLVALIRERNTTDVDTRTPSRRAAR